MHKHHSSPAGMIGEHRLCAFGETPENAPPPMPEDRNEPPPLPENRDSPEQTPESIDASTKQEAERRQNDAQQNIDDAQKAMQDIKNVSGDVAADMGVDIGNTTIKVSVDSQRNAGGDQGLGEGYDPAWAGLDSTAQNDPAVAGGAVDTGTSAGNSAAMFNRGMGEGYDPSWAGLDSPSKNETSGDVAKADSGPDQVQPAPKGSEQPQTDVQPPSTPEVQSSVSDANTRPDASQATPGTAPKGSEQPSTEAKQKAEEAAQSAVESADSDNPNAERVKKAFDKAKGAKDGGAFLVAAVELLRAVQDLLRGTAPDSPSQRSETAQDKPAESDKPSGTETGSEKSRDTAESPNAREDRLRSEINASKAENVQEFKKEKEGGIAEKRDALDKKIGAEQGRIASLEAAKNTANAKIQEAEKEMNAAGTTPERKDDLRREIRDLTDGIAATEKQMQNSQQDIKDYTEQRKNVDATTTEDIKAIDAMVQRGELVANAVALLQSKFGELRSSIDAGVVKKMEGLINGVSVAPANKGLDQRITLNPDAQNALKEFGVKIDGMVDANGVVANSDLLLGEIAKIMEKMRQSPAAGPSANVSPDAVPQQSRDIAQDIKGEFSAAVAGTLANTTDIVQARMQRMQAALVDAQKDLAEVKSSWNPLRNGEQRVKEKEVAETLRALDAMGRKLIDVRNIAKIEDPKKQMDALMAMRRELGLPAVPAEFAKDYDTFQKMAMEGVENKDKSLGVDYGELGKEYAAVEQNLAQLEAGVRAMDQAVGVAASAIPGGGFVYDMARNGTAIVTGELTPTQAATNVVTSALLGKVGKKVLSTPQGRAIMERYVQKIAKEFADPAKLKAMLVKAKDMGADIIGKTADYISDASDVVTSSLDQGGRWLGEQGFALYNETIAPNVEKMTAAGKEKLAQGLQALKEIKDGVMQSTAEGFGKGYKEQFAKIYGPRIDQAKDLLVRAGLDRAQVDGFVRQVASRLEQTFDTGMKTVGDINERGISAVASDFASDMGAIASGAYQENLKPYVDQATDASKQLYAQAEGYIKDVSQGMQTMYADVRANGFTGTAEQFKQQFHQLYGPAMTKAENALRSAGVPGDKIAAFRQGVERQFDAGIQTLNDIRERGLTTVLGESASDIGTLASSGFDTYLRPSIDQLSAEAKPHVERAVATLKMLRTGTEAVARQGIQNAQTAMAEWQRTYGPAVNVIRTELSRAFTPENAQRFVASVLQDVEGRFRNAANTVRKAA